MKQRDRYTTTAASAESAKSAMFVCEVPLRSGSTRLIDLQTSKPTAWRVASDHVSIQTYTSSASSQTKPGLQSRSSTGRSWSSATDLNLDNVRVHRAAANKLNIKSRATRGSVCNALLSRGQVYWCLSPQVSQRSGCHQDQFYYPEDRDQKERQFRWCHKY